MNYRLYFYVPWEEAKKEAPKDFIETLPEGKKIKMYLTNLTINKSGYYDLGATSEFAFADIYPKALALMLKKDIIKVKIYLEEVKS